MDSKTEKQSELMYNKKIKEIMTLAPECINSKSTISEAAIKMKKINAGFLPVCEKDKIIGVVTDRDIVIKGIAIGKDLSSNIKEVMTFKLIYCFEDASLDEAVNKMENEHIRRIVVLDRNKKLTGILSLDDIAVRAGSRSLAGEILERINKNIAS